MWLEFFAFHSATKSNIKIEDFVCKDLAILQMRKKENPAANRYIPT